MSRSSKESDVKECERIIFLPAGVPLWYSEPRIKLRSLVRILPSVFSYRLRTFREVNGLVMLLIGCLYMPRKFLVLAKFIQCRKYKWSMIGSSSNKVLLLSLCPHCVGS